MAVLENLEPKRVFYYFEELTKIPHGSGNTKEISDYLVEFAKKRGLRYIQDESNNVVIFKDASEGYEKAPVVMLQGHMDMVCEKKPESSHDFAKDALRLGIDGDFIYAKDTTLGGDDGIAVAYALAILEDDTLQHPALEIVITVDEEIGLLGAAALDTVPLKAKYLLNLDSEEEGYLWAGCAGGMTAVSKLPVRYQEYTNEKWKVTVSGLKGGHSGAEIDRNRQMQPFFWPDFFMRQKAGQSMPWRNLQADRKTMLFPGRQRRWYWRMQKTEKRWVLMRKPLRKHSAENTPEVTKVLR